VYILPSLAKALLGLLAIRTASTFVQTQHIVLSCITHRKVNVLEVLGSVPTVRGGDSKGGG